MESTMPTFTNLRSEVTRRVQYIKGHFLAYGWAYTEKELRRLACKELRQDAKRDAARREYMRETNLIGYLG